MDREEARIIKQVSDANQAYKDWGGNDFSFIIPVPAHLGTTPNISIEFYYSDADIKRLDKQGRRLFLSDEFHPSSRHKRDDLTCTDLSKIKRKDVSIIDDRVFDGHNKNVALPKSQFADYILLQEEGFNDFDVSEFQKIFDIIVMIIEENDFT
jgi:RNA-directed DNA polymerase